jgi:nicotinamide riboside transporter PnuC
MMGVSEAGAPEERWFMWLIIGIVLIVLWLGGFLVFHTAGFLIHILLILAVISIIFHFLRGGSRA